MNNNSNNNSSTQMLLDVFSLPNVVALLSIKSLVDLDTSCGSDFQRFDLSETFRETFRGRKTATLLTINDDLILNVKKNATVCQLLDWLTVRRLKCAKIYVQQGYYDRITPELMSSLVHYLLDCHGRIRSLKMPANKQLLETLTEKNFGFAPRIKFTNTMDIVDDTLMTAILGSVPRLDHLHIGDGFFLSNITFDILGNFFPMLQTLTSEGEIHSELLDKCHNLVHLEAKEIHSFDCLKHIATQCCNLRKLSISCVDDGENSFCGFPDNITTHLDSVESLRLGLGCLTQSCFRLTAFVRMCVKLKHLNLNRTGISGEDLKTICAVCKHLTVVECRETGVNDTGFRSVVFNCAEIRVMEFSMCPYVTDISARAVSLYCKNLLYLGLYESGVTHEYIALILNNNPQLLNVVYSTTYRHIYLMLQDVVWRFPESIRKYFIKCWF